MSTRPTSDPMASSEDVPGARTPRLTALLRDAVAQVGDRPSVVLFGNYGSGNMGDEAILRAVLEAFGDQVDLTVMSRQPARITSLHPNAGAAQMLSWRGVRRVIVADIVAIGGGGIFGNNMSLLPLLLPVAARALQLLRKRVVFVAIGAYRTTPGLLRRVLRRTAANALLVTVRDEESAEVLGVGHSQLVPDPGASIRPAAADEVDAAVRALDLPPGPLLGISLKPTVDAGHDDRQVDLAVRAARRWRSVHPRGGVVLLCLSDVGNFGLGHDVSDRTLADRVRDEVGSSVPTDVFGPSVTPWLMKGVIGRCDAVVAHRLHAQLFAHDEGVPFFGLSWERKSDVFLESVGASRVDLTTGEGDDVVDWVGALQVNRATA